MAEGVDKSFNICSCAFFNVFGFLCPSITKMVTACSLDVSCSLHDSRTKILVGKDNYESFILSAVTLDGAAWA